MGQITVFSGAGRRRRWSTDEKRTLVAAAFAPGAIVSEVAPAADLRANQIYAGGATWGTSTQRSLLR